MDPSVVPEPVTSPVTGDVASSGDGAIPLVGAVVAGRVEAIRRVAGDAVLPASSEGLPEQAAVNANAAIKVVNWIRRVTCGLPHGLAGSRSIDPWPSEVEHLSSMLATARMLAGKVAITLQKTADACDDA